jgi:hypothetical protein
LLGRNHHVPYQFGDAVQLVEEPVVVRTRERDCESVVVHFGETEVQCWIDHASVDIDLFRPRREVRRTDHIVDVCLSDRFVAAVRPLVLVQGICRRARVDHVPPLLRQRNEPLGEVGVVHVWEQDVQGLLDLSVDIEDGPQGGERLETVCLIDQ